MSAPRPQRQPGPTCRTNTGAEAGDNDHSDTNTQEAGVDEPTLSKPTAQFIYTLREKSLVIVNAVPADQMNIASRTDVEGNPVGMYLHGNRLTVVSESYNWRIEPMPVITGRVADGAPADRPADGAAEGGSVRDGL
jgi:uncharacterized secreted protein with C-terminal beta-propeller domain